LTRTEGCGCDDAPQFINALKQKKQTAKRGIYDGAQYQDATAEMLDSGLKDLSADSQRKRNRKKERYRKAYIPYIFRHLPLI